MDPTDGEERTHGDVPPYRLPRQPRPIFAGSCAHRHPEILGPRTYLDRLRIHHMDLGHRVMQADDGRIYLPDLLIMSMLQRSYGLVEAIIDAVDGYNLHAAAPLVRLQLDTLFRASYMTRAPDADKVARDVLAGIQFRKMTDIEGKKLTDGRLKDLAEPHHGWAVPVYDRTSGWVHLSMSHVTATWHTTHEEGTVALGIPIRPEIIPVRLWRELLGAMIQATEEFFGYVETWESRKGLPLRETRPWPSSPSSA